MIVGEYINNNKNKYVKNIYNDFDLNNEKKFEKIKEKQDFNFLVNTGLYMMESKVLFVNTGNSELELLTMFYI